MQDRVRKILVPVGVPIFIAWSISMVYTLYVAKTASTKVAKLFKNGRSQAVRLPKEFRFEGDRVRVRKVPEGVLLEPVDPTPEEWLARIRSFDADDLFPKGRKKSKPPVRRYFN